MSARHHALVALALVAAGLGLSACGITDPYAAHPGPTPRPAPSSTQGSTTTTVAVTDADPAPEQGGTIPADACAPQCRLATSAAQETPQDAVARYARLYINWTANTVAQVQRHLASLSLDGARAQALQAAAHYQHDSTLTASHIANSGSVVSIAPGEGDAEGEWVVVTRERTTGSGDYAGLPASLHVIYARVVRQASGWVITGWAPQD
jgi:hypothetical protein